jgi:hypothetical protein
MRGPATIIDEDTAAGAPTHDGGHMTRVAGTQPVRVRSAHQAVEGRLLLGNQSLMVGR